MPTLALERDPGERVRLRMPDGSVVWVKYVLRRGDVIRLSFDAPLTVEIDREDRLIARDKEA